MICNYDTCTDEHDVTRVFHKQDIPYCEDHDPMLDDRVCGFLKREAQA